MLHVAIQLSSTLNLKSSPSLPSAGESTKCYPHSTSSPKTTLFSAKAAASIRRTQIPAATCGHAFCLVGKTNHSRQPGGLGRLGKNPSVEATSISSMSKNDQKPIERWILWAKLEFHVHRIERVISLLNWQEIPIWQSPNADPNIPICSMPQIY
jgi:hypothetical protein